MKDFSCVWLIAFNINALLIKSGRQEISHRPELQLEQHDRRSNFSDISSSENQGEAEDGTSEFSLMIKKIQSSYY